MEIFANELSIHRQFHNLKCFLIAFGYLMGMRKKAEKFGRKIYLHRAFLNVEPMGDISLQKAIQAFPEAQRRSAMVWLTQRGPFWSDHRQHGPDDWFECHDMVVTDSAVGEAAYRALHGSHCSLVSIVPSDWNFSPVEVDWRRGGEGLKDQKTFLGNWRDIDSLTRELERAAPPLRNWNDLHDAAVRRFSKLIFAEDCFTPLEGYPFSSGTADRFLELLGILERFASAFDAAGNRTAEGQQIYQDYFTGGSNALFSDSSDTEKSKFRTNLTFAHPESPGDWLFCTWHGKIRRMTLRLHYYWSGKVGEPLYVVYAGPKLTKT